MDVWPGQPFPLGATYDGTGTNFALYSEVAEQVELCLFDDDGNEKRVDLPEVTAACWHGHLPGVVPGQRYGFRVHGPWEPAAGHLANPAKLLLDPYAKALSGEVVDDPALLVHKPGDPARPSDLDSAPFVPKAVVVDPWFDWGGDQPPSTPAARTVIYETGVAALSAAHPDVADDLRGTYAALAHPAVVGHLTRLGVTAVMLRSVASPLTGFAPDPGLGAWAGAGQSAQEFRHMVKALHADGLEVLVDVNPASTAEAAEPGRVLSFHGIDNAVYYGVGGAGAGAGPTSLDLGHPAVVRLVMDGLRHWVEVLHVDGFRFRFPPPGPAGGGDGEGGLLSLCGVLGQDPVLSRVKLMADPGPQDGPPPEWLQWNRRYADFAGRFWAGRPVALDEFALRLAGSPDLHGHRQPPYAGLNVVDTAAVPGARLRRSLLGLLFLSQGIPVLTSGDELEPPAPAQPPAAAGGDRAPLAWDRLDETTVEFIRRLSGVRRRQPLLQRRDPFTRRPLHGPGSRDFAWFLPTGAPIAEADWPQAGAATVAVLLDGEAIAALGPRGERIVDATLLALVNASAAETSFTIPDWPAGRRFTLVFDSAAPDDEEGAGSYKTGDSILVAPGSVVLLRLRNSRSTARP